MKLKPAALSATEFYTALVVKILAGVFYGYLFLHYYHGDDTWRIHHLSLKETQILLNAPLRFFTDEFTPINTWRKADSVVQFIILYANDLEYALTIKTLAFLNLISQGNYYINSAIFNLIIFWGHYWCFLFFKDLFPKARKQLFLLIFFFPPVAFWLSGIRADGILFFFISLYLLCLQRRKNIFLIVLAFFFFFVLRPQMGILLLLATITYLICSLSPGKALFKFSLIYLLAGTLYWIVGGMENVIDVQHKFSILQGTRFNLPALQPNIGSFISLFPLVFANVFFRPFLWEVHSLLQLAYSVEVIFFCIVICYSIIRYPVHWRTLSSNYMVLLLLGFAITLCILIGYTVPFPGAIARYRIIPELFILCIAAGSFKNTN